MVSGATSVPRKVEIYGLVDPRNGHLRYVGKTVQSAAYRFAQHMSHRVRNRTKCSSWIRSLQNAGMKPEMVSLEACEEMNWKETEKFWIASFKLMGADLTNLAEGGTGSSGFKLTAEQKAKIAKAMTGRKLSDENKRKLALSKIGKPRPDLAARNALSRGCKRKAISFTQSGDVS